MTRAGGARTLRPIDAPAPESLRNGGGAALGAQDGRPFIATEFIWPETLTA